MSSSLGELYDRMIDLAIKVLEGDIDPFDVDVGKFIDQLSKYKNLDELELDYLIRDIRALNGLINILESQGRTLKKRGMGLYLDELLLKLKIYKMDIEELAGIFAFSWKPIISLEALNEESIKEALLYFNSLSDLASRRLTLEKLNEYIPSDFEPKIFVIPSNLRDLMNKLYDDLKNLSKGKYIEYERFIKSRGDPVENAYILSFLISEGWIDVKVNRLEEKIWLRPKPYKKEPVNSSSLAVVIRREKGEEN